MFWLCAITKFCVTTELQRLLAGMTLSMPKLRTRIGLWRGEVFANSLIFGLPEKPDRCRRSSFMEVEFASKM